MLRALARPESLHWPAGTDTLAAVVLGALLAMLSGVVTTQLEAHFDRRRRERAAALLFAEVFLALDVLLARVEEARATGEPYGPVTQRMLRAARRELDVYDRNRESVCELHDPKLRYAIQALTTRLGISLDGLLDPSADTAARDRSLQFMRESAAELPRLVDGLRRLGRAPPRAATD